MEALAQVLRRASVEQGLQGHAALQASWSASALWRLCDHAPNVHLVASSCATVLVELLLLADCHTSLRLAALGAVCRMLEVGEIWGRYRGDVGRYTGDIGEI